MKIFINNIEIDKNIITVNSGMNFNRFDVVGIIDEYKIVLSVRRFTNTVETDYNNISDEIRFDDEQQGDTSVFKDVDYCSINELINSYANQLYPVVSGYLDRTLLEHLFPESESKLFIINSVDSVVVEGNNIVISGRGYRKEKKG